MHLKFQPHLSSPRRILFLILYVVLRSLSSAVIVSESRKYFQNLKKNSSVFICISQISVFNVIGASFFDVDFGVILVSFKKLNA